MDWFAECLHTKWWGCCFSKLWELHFFKNRYYLSRVGKTHQVLSWQALSLITKVGKTNYGCEIILRSHIFRWYLHSAAVFSDYPELLSISGFSQTQTDKCNVIMLHAPESLASTNVKNRQWVHYRVPSYTICGPFITFDGSALQKLDSGWALLFMPDIL